MESTSCPLPRITAAGRLPFRSSGTILTSRSTNQQRARRRPWLPVARSASPLSGSVSAPSSSPSTRPIPTPRCTPSAGATKAELDEFGDTLRHQDSLHRATKSCSSDPNVDAVHINSPIPDHAAAEPRGAQGRQARRLHRADGHHASRNAGNSSRRSGRRGKVYMMMETVVYSREYLFVKELYDKGELGRIQFLRGSHQQDMDGWPGYWPGLPPMHYATHCVSPCLAICSGKHGRERGLPRLGPDPRGADRPSTAARSPSRRRRSRSRASDVVRRGDAQPVRHGPAIPRELRRLRQQEELRVAAGRERGAGAFTPGACPSRRSRSASRCRTTLSCCPSRSARFTQPAAIQDAEHLSFLQGGGHGGSHPHLAHNLLMADPGREAGPARCADVGQLDHGRHLPPPVGHEGRRARGDSAVLTPAAVGRASP